MPTQRKGVALFYSLNAGVYIKIEKLFHHVGSLGRAEYGYLRITADNIGNGSAVIRFHMVHNQIIQIPSLQNTFQVFHKRVGKCRVGCIEQRAFLIHKNIRVIGYASGNRINIFKQGDLPVVDANPVKRLRNPSGTIH